MYQVDPTDVLKIIAGSTATKKKLLRVCDAGFSGRDRRIDQSSRTKPSAFGVSCNASRSNKGAKR